MIYWVAHHYFDLESASVWFEKSLEMILYFAKKKTHRITHQFDPITAQIYVAMVIKYFYHRPDNMVDSVREVSPVNLMMKTDHFDPLFILYSWCNLIGWRFESKQIILIHPRIQFVNKITETNNHSVKTLNQCTLNAVTVSCVDLTTKTTKSMKNRWALLQFRTPYFIRSFL